MTGIRSEDCIMSVIIIMAVLFARMVDQFCIHIIRESLDYCRGVNCLVIDVCTAEGRLLTPLRPSDLKEVCDQLDAVKVQWENIGLHLDLPYSILANIESEHSHSQKRLRMMILAWLNGRGKKPPTWQSLIDALKHHTVGENVTADDIRTYVLSKKASGKHVALLSEYSVLISPV